MQFSTKTSLPERLKAGCVVVPVLAGKPVGAGATLVSRLGEARIARLLAGGELQPKAGSTLLVHTEGGIERLLLVSVGDDPAVADKAFAEAARAVARALSQLPAHDAVSLLDDAPTALRGTGWKLRTQVLALRDAGYRFDRMKSKPEPATRGARAMQFVVDKREQALAERELSRAVALADGMTLTKDLGNLPGNVCTPTYLADEARALAKEFGLRVDVLGARQMEALRMGALLAVAQGSEEAPRLIVLHYQGASKAQAPVCLVGKGVTFDTGGISIKPAAEMDEMKYDMCGAASVLGTLRAVAAMKLPVNVVGVIPAVENMPSGKAVKPGDIVTSLSGQTIEILNTDAEGRLILCDALTYARRFKPAAVIDIATLTGACVVALGQQHHGLFTRTDALAAELQDAGREMQDTAWRMPLDDEYQDLLKSNFADMANIGGRMGGAITAACFLSRFTKDLDWAHLDIAGTAWKGGAAKGASGRPVPLLVRFLINRAEG